MWKSSFQHSIWPAAATSIFNLQEQGAALNPHLLTEHRRIIQDRKHISPQGAVNREPLERETTNK